MVSLEATSKCLQQVEPIISSPRISFSAEFLDENNFISICPKEREREREKEKEKDTDKQGSARNAADFEFLSGDKTNMIAADELFSEGKLLPFWQVQPLDKLNKISLKSENAESVALETDQTSTNDVDRRISWFLDDDPSPRPPKCTVLWKELLRLKKQRPSTLSPSSSSSSSSSSQSDQTPSEERKKGAGSRDKVVNKVKKGLERTRSANIRIRPMINVPICTAARTAALPPLFPTRRGRLES